MVTGGGDGAGLVKSSSPRPSSTAHVPGAGRRFPQVLVVGEPVEPRAQLRAPVPVELFGNLRRPVGCGRPSAAAPVTRRTTGRFRGASGVANSGLAPLDGLEQVDGDVGHLHLVLVDPGALHAVVEHDVAEGAGGGDPGGAGARWPPGPARRSPSCRSTPPSTCAPRRRRSTCPWCRCGGISTISMPFRRADHLAGREVHVVVAAEVAGVVVGDPLLERGRATRRAGPTR